MTAQHKTSVKNILIIDDDVMMLSALRTLLEGVQYRVTTATDGNMGISMFRDHQPDVVLLDLKLPSISGIETLRQIKLINSNAKVIVVTGFSSPEAIEETKQLGAFYFYEKSSNVDELVQAVRKAVA